MTHITNKRIATLQKAPQPPLSHRGAAPDSDRAKKWQLTEPLPATKEGSWRWRRGLGDFGSRLENSAQLNKITKMTRWLNGMVTTVRELNQPWLKKV